MRAFAICPPVICENDGRPSRQSQDRSKQRRVGQSVKRHCSCTQRPAVNWNQLGGQWQQLTGRVKSTWGKLTDSDVQTAGGRRDQLVGQLQAYGVPKADAESEIDDWPADLNEDKGSLHG
jgi:uncharacterized protein YjbJ (UPF0337 family)